MPSSFPLLARSPRDCAASATSGARPEIKSVGGTIASRLDGNNTRGKGLQRIRISFEFSFSIGEALDPSSRSIRGAHTWIHLEQKFVLVR